MAKFRVYKYRKLERLVRGFANHRRLQIMDLLKRKSELSVFEIADELNINFKNTAQHLQKLAAAGLVLKRSFGSAVHHKLTSRALAVLNFLKKLDV